MFDVFLDGIQAIMARNKDSNKPLILPVTVIPCNDWTFPSHIPVAFTPKDSNGNAVIYVRDDYDYITDKKGWMIHHVVYYVAYLLEVTTIPKFSLEAAAFAVQFEFIKDNTAITELTAQQRHSFTSVVSYLGLDKSNGDMGVYYVRYWNSSLTITSSFVVTILKRWIG